MPASRRLRGPGSALLLTLATAASAQEAPIQFGKLDAKEAAALAAQAPLDSAAGAEVLCDFGVSQIKGAQDGFEAKFERTARIRILRRTGYDWATVRVPLYHNKEGKREQLLQVKGLTYNLGPDGRLTKDPLRTEAVFSRKINDRVDEYAFTLPNVREGSVVEFTYSIRSPFLFNLQDWQFQQTVPVRWSEYRAVIPSFFRYKEITRTYWPFAVNENTVVPYSTSYRHTQQDSYGSNLQSAPGQTYSLTTQANSRRWVLKNLPAFREEPFLTTPDDYFSRLDFELERIQFGPDEAPAFIASSWPDIEKELLEDETFGQYLRRDSPLKPAAAALRALPDPAARAAAVRQLVQQAVGYTGQPTLHARNSPKRVVELRQGNAAEINLLLLALLRNAGLDAQPLLLSTRGHGQVQTELPVLSQFNYVVAHVALPGGKDLLLDATTPTLPASLLPEHCLNGQGRLLGPAGRWVPLNAARPHLQYTHARFTLDAQGGLSGTVRQEAAGYAAPDARQPAAALRQQWQQAHPDWQITKAEAPAATTDADLERPATLTLDVHLPGSSEAASTLYVRPLQHLVPATNPFSMATRRLYPADLGVARQLEHSVDLTLPAGYAATEVPADALLTLPNGGGRFLFSVTRPTPTTLRYTSRLQLLKTHYSATEYAGLRELYARALAKFAEPVVVQRR